MYNGTLRLNDVFHFLFCIKVIPAMLIVYTLIHAFNVDVYLSAAQGPFILVLIVFTLSILSFTHILSYLFSAPDGDFPNIFASQNKIKKWFKDDNHSPYSEDLIIEKLLKYPNEIILCVGPLTNLYPAEMKHPCVLALIRDIYIMGGTFESGNNNIYNEETTSNTKINTNNSHAKIYMGTINDISSSQCHDNNEKHIYNKNINNISYFNGIIGISANSFRKSPLLPPLENIIENGLESLLNEKSNAVRFGGRSQTICMFIWI